MNALVTGHGGLPHKSISFILGNSKGRGMVVPDAAIAAVDEDDEGPSRFVIEEDMDDSFDGHESVPLGRIPTVTETKRRIDSSHSSAMSTEPVVAFDGVPQSADNVIVCSLSDDGSGDDTSLGLSDNLDVVNGKVYSPENGDQPKVNGTYGSPFPPPPAECHPMGIRNIALPLHYFFAGVVHAIVIGVLYGCLMGVMAIKAHVYATACIVVNMPWSSKFVIGFVSDWFPFAGYRRKSYGIAGWMLVVTINVCFGVLYREPTPYYCLDSEGKYNERLLCNPAARKDAYLLVVYCTTLVFGVVVSESACDGLLVECSQETEGAAESGKLQVDCMILRLVGVGTGAVAMAFGFSSRTHLGFYATDVGLTGVFATTGIIAAVMVVAWGWLSQRDKPQAVNIACSSCCIGSSPIHTSWNYNTAFTRCSVARHQFQRLFALISTRKFFFFLIYQLVAPTIVAMESPTDGMMRRYWADVQQLQYQLSIVVTSVFYLLMLVGIRSCCLRTNWRVLVSLSVLSSIFVSSPVCILTATGVIRDQYFFLLQDIFNTIPSACNFLVATLSCITLAPKGHEATVYGLTTTMHAIAPVLARSLSNVLYGSLPVLVTGDRTNFGQLSDPEEYITDDSEIRFVVMVSLVTEMLLMLLSLAFLPCLPKDKEHVLGMTNPNLLLYKPVLGGLVLVIVFIVLLGSTTLNFMAIIPGMSCLRLVGGEGCG